MSDTAQAALVTANFVASSTPLARAANGIAYGSYGETRQTGAELERIVQAVPVTIAAALANKAYYFVPLTIGEDDEVLIAPAYTTDLADRSICHRNLQIAKNECVFISTRLMQDKFALAFEFFINVGHNFVDAAGVPTSFSELAWAQAQADVRGETSQDAWESRRMAFGLTVRDDDAPRAGRVDEKAKTAFLEAAFSDAIAIYLLSLTVDFDYSELREREYPLLAPRALADRLRHIEKLFPPNKGYEFAVLYRRRGSV